MCALKFPNLAELSTLPLDHGIPDTFTLGDTPAANDASTVADTTETASTIGAKPDISFTGLVTSRDSAGISETHRTSARVPKQVLAPFNQRTMLDVLTRLHPVATIKLDSTHTRGAELGVLSFPGIFAAFPNIMHKLANFAYYRSGVRVEFRIVGSPAHSGAVSVCYIKECITTLDTIELNKAAWLDQHIIDVGVPSTIVLDIPWVNPYGGSELPFDNTSGAAEIARVWLHCLHPLRTMNQTVPAPVTIQVYAALQGIEYWADILETLSVSNIKSEKIPDSVIEDYLRKMKAKSHSHPEALAKMVNNLAAKGEGSQRPQSLIGDVISAVAPEALSIIGLNKPAYPKTPIGAQIVQNYDLATSSGIALLPSISYHMDSTVDSNSRLFGDPRKFETVRDLASLPGEIFCVEIDASSTVPGTILKTIPVSPIYNVDLTTPDTWTFVPTPCAYIASHFTYWRGSMKYKLVITGSQFTPCKLGVSFFPTRSTIPDNAAAILANHGDIPTIIIDVIGSTTKDFSVPYIADQPYLTVGDPVSTLTDEHLVTGFLVFFVLSPPPIVSPEGNLFMSIFASGGDDILFAAPNPRFKSGTPSSTTAFTVVNPEIAKAHSVWDAFDKPFPSMDITRSRSWSQSASEVPMGIKELISKPVMSVDTWAEAGVAYFGSGHCTNGWVQGWEATYEDTGLWHRLMSTFRYWRGSRYVWLIPSTSNALTTVLPGYVGRLGPTFIFDTLGPAMSMTATVTPIGNSNVIKVDRGFIIPWSSPLGLFSINPICDVSLNTSPPYLGAAAQITNTGADCWQAPGDDFCWGGLIYPAPVIFPPPVAVALRNKRRQIVGQRRHHKPIIMAGSKA